MPTPWLEFSNCRILWKEPTAGVIDLRNGPAVATRDVAIEAAIKISNEFDAPADRSRAAADGVATSPLFQSYRGYLTRWVVVPNNATWLDIGTDWTWTSTGRRPARLRASELDYLAYLGPIGSLPATADGQFGQITFSLVGSHYGDGGIGALLLAEQGEELRGTFRIST